MISVRSCWINDGGSRSLAQESAVVLAAASDGLTVLGGGAQVLAAVPLLASCPVTVGAGCIAGGVLLILGSDNLLEGGSRGEIAVLRDGLLTATGDQQTADLVHMAINLGTSATVLLRRVPVPSGTITNPLIGEKSTEAAVRQLTRFEIMVEFITNTNTIIGVTSP